MHHFRLKLDNVHRNLVSYVEVSDDLGTPKPSKEAMLGRIYLRKELFPAAKFPPFISLTLNSSGEALDATQA